MRYLMLSGYINIRTRFAPFDVATDYYGYIYVADGGNTRIQKFTSDGQFVTKWGSEVYSALPDDGAYDQKGTTIMDNRYIRHEY